MYIHLPVDYRPTGRSVHVGIPTEGHTSFRSKYVRYVHSLDIMTSCSCLTFRCIQVLKGGDVETKGQEGRRRRRSLHPSTISGTNESHLRRVEGRSPPVPRHRVYRPRRPRILRRSFSQQNNFGKPWTRLVRRREKDSLAHHGGSCSGILEHGRSRHHGGAVAGADSGRAPPGPGIRLRGLRRARRRRFGA